LTTLEICDNIKLWNLKNLIYFSRKEETVNSQNNRKKIWKKFVNIQEKMVINHIKQLFNYAREKNLPKVRKGIKMFASIIRNIEEALQNETAKDG